MNVMFVVVVQATLKEEKKLMAENAKLKKDIEEMKEQLLGMEKRGGGIINKHNILYSCGCFWNNEIWCTWKKYLYILDFKTSTEIPKLNTWSLI